jgi:geranylgeranyl pyrophosphate synthase
MVDLELDTMKYISNPSMLAGYDLIQDRLNLVEERLLAEQVPEHSFINDAAVQLLRAGGKRIRAAISLLSAATFDANYDRAISLAAGVEMLHTATLVHDDIIDDAAQRRGKPTLNANMDTKLSVLIGDYFFARAANLVAETDNLDIMKQFSRTLMTILNGEVNQQLTRWQIDRKSYFDRIYAKTGAMFVLAAKSAATLADASETNLRAIENFGYYTGIAFQIVDDVLDFTSKASQLGKPVGSDLREGIYTLPVLLFADRYPEDPNLQLIHELQDGKHPSVENLITSIRNSEATDLALAEAENFITRGKQALNILPYSPYTDALSSLAGTIINRAA